MFLTALRLGLVLPPSFLNCLGIHGGNGRGGGEGGREGGVEKDRKEERKTKRSK